MVSSSYLPLHRRRLPFAISNAAGLGLAMIVLKDHSAQRQEDAYNGGAGLEQHC
jgi:hypothetical protein